MKNGLIVIGFLLFSLNAFCQEKDICILSDSLKIKAENIAEKWFTELFKANDIEKLMEISDVPFAFDRKKIITSTEDLKKAFQEVFDDGKLGKVPVHKIKYIDCKSETIEECIPINIVRFLVLLGENDNDKGILIALSLRDNNFKVVGLSD